ncbi:MAG: tetratricopeptide repeat protein [Acidobacteria bacterium]|nr:tetratricopeptide repeat protein [Acidobacteriota bacterium]
MLPFISLNNGVDDDYLGLGIADTLITKLSNLRELVVRPTGSVRKYMTLDQDPIVAGREQQVDSVLEGSIQRAGERIRVTVRLINLPDGRPIWAYQCDEQQCADIFALQDAIAQQVAEALILDLSGAEHQALAKHYTEDREAYDLYLRGRFFLGKRSAGAIEKSRHYFQQAIRRDPNFALAYTGLAESYAGYLIRQDNLASAMAAAIRALEIDDTLAEAHTALGLLSWQFEWNWEQADREFRRALELNPRYPAAHNWYSVFLSTVERHEEALSHARQAQALDPFSTHSKVHLGLVFYAARQTDQAMLEWRKALELDPYRPNLHANLGRCYVQKRQYQEALQEFNKEIEVGGSKLICDAYIAFVNAVSGRRAEALSKLDELTKQSDQQAVAFYKAMIYAGLDDRDKVFEWLEVAYAERTGPLWYRLNVDPWWDKVRTDPRFVDILRRMRLPIPSGGNTGRS